MKKKQRSIIEAAKTLFIKNGYNKTTIADISKYGMLSQVTIYKYYESKYELAKAVWVDIIESGYQKYFSTFDKNISFIEIIKTTIAYKQELLINVHETFYSFFLEELSKSDSCVRIAYDSKKEETYETIVSLGKKSNMIDSSLSNSSLYLFFDMFVEYFRNASNKESTASIIKSEFNNLLSLMLYGLFGKK